MTAGHTDRLEAALDGKYRRLLDAVEDDGVEAAMVRIPLVK